MNLALNCRRTVIVDIDGTLNKHSDKWLSYAPENDAANRELLRNMEPNQAVIDLVNSLYFLGHDIIIMTGRPEKFRHETEFGLLDKRVLYSGTLFMRPDDSNISDADVKEAFLELLLNIGKDIWLVLEDRDSCVDMWRRRGFLCLQPVRGNF